MANNESRRLKPSIIQSDVESLQAAKILDGYKPANTDFELNKVQTAYDEMIAAREIEMQKNAAAEEARDMAAAKEWAYHNIVLGMKNQVIAQYGDDSAEVQSLGLKRKSEYKPRTRTAGKQ